MCAPVPTLQGTHAEPVRAFPALCVFLLRCSLTRGWQAGCKCESGYFWL